MTIKDEMVSGGMASVWRSTASFVRKVAVFLAFLLGTKVCWADFTCSVVIGEGEVGQSRAAVVSYTGGGSDAPLVRIEAGEGAYVRFSEADAWTKQVEFLALGGEGSQTIFCMADSVETTLELSHTFGGSGQIPWETLGEALRPSYVNADAWRYAEKELEGRLGTTWSDYLARLRANAAYLAGRGRETCRTDRLLSLEISRALGINAVVPILASSTDLVRPARGLPLLYTRSFPSALYTRFDCGVLGYGWKDNYSVQAELTDDTTLLFRLPTGGVYQFSKTTGDWQPDDARDRTVLTETSADYILTAENGTVLTFSKANMRLKDISDRDGNSLTLVWEGTCLQSVTHSDGPWLKFAYTADGRLESVGDDLGHMVKYAYNGQSMLVSMTGTDGLKTLYGYRDSSADLQTCTARALTSITRPDQATRRFEYDAVARLTAISDNAEGIFRFAYSDVATVTITAPDGGVTQVDMGASGEVLRTEDALGGIVGRSYDGDGLLKSTTAPSGRMNGYAHDAYGRVTAHMSASGQVTAFDYTELFGNLKTLRDARGNAMAYDHDDKGRVTAIQFPDGSKMLVEYNAHGDVQRTTNCRGQTETYTYDAEGRVASRTWENGRTFAYGYDGKGRLVTASDSETGDVAIQYDDADRMIRISYPDERGFSFAYDTCGRMVERRSFDGSAECFAYDDAGRIVEVTDGEGVPYLFNTYDEATGRLTSREYGNGVRTDYRYDLLGRTVSIEHLDASGNIAESLQYCYDADGRCIRASSLLGEERYGYDAAGQLTNVEYPVGTGESFSYDAVGNRTMANGVGYMANALNQYTKIGTVDYTYDADGNMTGKTEDGSTTTYVYDQQNRLVAVRNAEKGLDWSCTYDVLGNRVAVTENGVTTRRVVLPGTLPSVAAEYRDGVLVKRHVVVGALQLAEIDAVGGERYYHGDLIGSTRLVTDASGVPGSRLSYKSFGAVRSAVGDIPAAGYVGTFGVETDSTGLLFMRNRYYDPRQGRFIQRDPIGLSGGDVNWYRYCGNNPILLVDPNGLSFWDVLRKLNRPEVWIGTALAVTGAALCATVIGAPLGAYFSAAGLSVVVPVLLGGAAAIGVGGYTAANALDLTPDTWRNGVESFNPPGFDIGSYMPMEESREFPFKSLPQEFSLWVSHESGNWDETVSGVATVSGSFTISFEMKVTYNLLSESGGMDFFVDGASKGCGYIANNWGKFTVTVSGPGEHKLEWRLTGRFIKGYSLYPKIRGYVRNIKMRRIAETAAASMTMDSTQGEVVPSVRTASMEMPPRLYCYERYVVVKGRDYSFEVSADGGEALAVSGLPAGFTFADGYVTGRAAATSTREVTVSASGPGGRTAKTVVFEVIDGPEDFDEQVEDAQTRVEPAATVDEALGVPGLSWWPFDPDKGGYGLTIDHDWTWDGNGSVRTDAQAFDDEHDCGFSFTVTGPTQMKFRYAKLYSVASFYVSTPNEHLYRDFDEGDGTEWKQVVVDIPAGRQKVFFWLRPGYCWDNWENDDNGLWIDGLEFGDFDECELTYPIYYETSGASIYRSFPWSYTANDLPLSLDDVIPVPRDGYEFTGWSLGGETVTEIPEGTTGEITLTALWRRTFAEEYATGKAFEPFTLELGDGGTTGMKVTGLPAGLKFTAKALKVRDPKTKKTISYPANTIYGTPTKSGIYTVVARATTAGGRTITERWTFVVRRAGERVVRTACETARGTVSGRGVYAKGKKATLKATAKKGYVFAGWELEGAALPKGFDARNPVLTLTVGAADITARAKFIPVSEDWAAVGVAAGSATFAEEYTTGGAFTPVTLAFAGGSRATVKVSGLPAGLKFTAKALKVRDPKAKRTTAYPANTIYGKPTKSGIYTVTAKVATAGGKTATVRWTFSVRKPGERAVWTACDAARGAVSGRGVYAKGKKVTLRATAKKGYVFAGWELEGADLSAGADARNPVLAFTPGAADVTATARFAPASDDRTLALLVDGVAVAADGSTRLVSGRTGFTLSVESISLPKLVLSGLPAGLKFNAATGRLAGRGTKPGLYTVTAKLSNATVRRAVARRFRVEVPNFTAANALLRDGLANAPGEVYSAYVGVRDFGAPSLVPADAARAKTMKVTGLPTGLRFDAKRAARGLAALAGVPAKAGTYVVKVAVGGKTSTFTLKVRALPSWAVGTFTGCFDETGADGTALRGTAAFTVSAAGKVSAKLVRQDGKAASWTHACLDRAEADAAGGVSFRVDAVVGGFRCEVSISAAAREGGPAQGVLAGTRRPVDAEDAGEGVVGLAFDCVQNLWGRGKALEGLAAKLKGRKVALPTIRDEQGNSYDVSLAFGAGGAVTAKYRLNGGAAQSASGTLAYRGAGELEAGGGEEDGEDGEGKTEQVSGSSVSLYLNLVRGGRAFLEVGLLVDGEGVVHWVDGRVAGDGEP